LISSAALRVPTAARETSEVKREMKRQKRSASIMAPMDLAGLSGNKRKGREGMGREGRKSRVEQREMTRRDFG